MLVKTPTRFKSEKKLHTPPSINHEVSRQKPAKFLRSISGRVFRKTPDMKEQQMSVFDQSGSFTPTSTLHMSKRHNIPKPLNLDGPLSPPPTIRKPSQASNYEDELRSYKSLGSPINLASPLIIKKNSSIRSNLTNTLLIESLSDIAQLPKNEHEEIVVWTDDDHESTSYLEEASPLFNKKLSKNVGSKKYVGERCSICEENVSNTFSGEKILELMCRHPTHYSCYSTVLELLNDSDELPTCQICGEDAVPNSEGILINMKSKLLCSQNNNSSNPNEQWIALKSAKSATGLPLFTPLEQMIRTADICSDGFKTPVLNSKQNSIFVDSIISEENTTEEDDYREILGLSLDKGSDERLEEHIFELIEVSTTEHESNGSKELDIEVKIPEIDQGEEMEVSPSSATDKHSLKEIKDEISKYTIEQLSLNNDDYGDLFMFDNVVYSLEGDEWFGNTTVYYFQKCLILYNFVNTKIVGKIPVEQICSVISLNDRSILLVMKSTTLPEIYLDFSSISKVQLAGKWKYFLEHTGEEPYITNISHTALDLLSESLEYSVQGFIKEFGSDNNIPWVVNNHEVPLQLILCVNISSFSTRMEKLEKEERCEAAIKYIRNVLSMLNDDDLFGLVLLGKNGSGEVGEYGSFVGTINKYWDGWESVFEGINPIEDDVFQNADNELITMLQTSYRLVSTVEKSKRSPRYVNQIIMIRNQIDLINEDFGIAKKYERKIVEDNLFNIKQVNISEENALENELEKLHKQNIYDLTVRLGTDVVKFGSMGPGESKTKTLNVRPDTFRNRICDADWYDIKKKDRVSTTVSVKLE